MHPSFATRANLDLLDDYYRRWRDNPASVDDRWQAFFEGFELAGKGAGPCDTALTATREIGVYLPDSFDDAVLELAVLVDR